LENELEDKIAQKTKYSKRLKDLFVDSSEKRGVGLVAKTLVKRTLEV